MAGSWRLGLELQDHKQLPSERCVSHLSDAATRRRRPENPGGGPGTGQRAAQKSFAGQSCTQPASFRHSHDSATSIHDRTRPTPGIAARPWRTLLPLPGIIPEPNIRHFLDQRTSLERRRPPARHFRTVLPLGGTIKPPLRMLGARSSSQWREPRRPWQRPCNLLESAARV